MRGIAPKALIDKNGSVKLDLVEGTGDKSGRIFVRGEFSRADSPTENKRVYPGRLVEREIARMTKFLGSKQVLGEVDHPSDGRTSLNRVSHIITELELRDGVVYGEAEIIDTERGKNLAALLKAGARLGVSSRGYGSTKSNDNGEDVVQDDYRLVTYDFVAEPADTNAFPQPVFEGKEYPAMELTLESVKTDNPSLYKQLCEDAETAVEARLRQKFNKQIEADIAAAKVEQEKKLSDQFEAEILAKLPELRSEAEGKVRKEFETNPSIGGARKVVEQIAALVRPYIVPEGAEEALRGKDKEIETLRASLSERDGKIEKLTESAMRVGYRLVLEMAVSKDPDADLIRKMVGDVMQFKNKEEIQAKVESIIEELKKSGKRSDPVVAQSKIDESNTELKKAKSELDDANEEIGKLTTALEESVTTSKKLAMRVYTLNKIVGRSDIDAVKEILTEAAGAKSKDDIDVILDRHPPKKNTREDIEEARTRVRRMAGSGTQESRTILEEGMGPSRRNENWNDLGASADELRVLCGVGEKK